MIRRAQSLESKVQRARPTAVYADPGLASDTAIRDDVKQLTGRSELLTPFHMSLTRSTDPTTARRVLAVDSLALTHASHLSLELANIAPATHKLSFESLTDCNNEGRQTAPISYAG
jgi:hypothetical protein